VWEKVYAEDGIVVHTRFPEIINDEGDEETVFEWKLEAEREVEFQKCVSAIENVNLHKVFYGFDSSKVVANTDSSLLAYYYLDAPWPVPNFDVVREITTRIDTAQTFYTASHLSTPDKYVDKGALRLNVSDIHFQLEKVSENKTKIKINGRYVSQVIPDWIANDWFPDGPADILRSVVEHSR
jgi:hypothetical protein